MTLDNPTVVFLDAALTIYTPGVYEDTVSRDSGNGPTFCGDRILSFSPGNITPNQPGAGFGDWYI